MQKIVLSILRTPRIKRKAIEVFSEHSKNDKEITKIYSDFIIRQLHIISPLKFKSIEKFPHLHTEFLDVIKNNIKVKISFISDDKTLHFWGFEAENKLAFLCPENYIYGKLTGFDLFFDLNFGFKEIDFVIIPTFRFGCLIITKNDNILYKIKNFGLENIILIHNYVSTIHNHRVYIHPFDINNIKINLLKAMVNEKNMYKYYPSFNEHKKLVFLYK